MGGGCLVKFSKLPEGGVLIIKIVKEIEAKGSQVPHLNKMDRV
jgi:hypothetical protein